MTKEEEYKENSGQQSGKNPEPVMISDTTGELGAIGIGLAMVALSVMMLFDLEREEAVYKIIGLIIYILGGLGISFLYLSFLDKVAHEVAKQWIDKGLLRVKAVLWIYGYYFSLFREQIKGRNSIDKTRELGYLTILLILNILWLTFGVVIILVLIDKI
jgi:hypothetical protein